MHQEMSCLPNILSLYLLCMYLNGLLYVNIIYNVEVDPHSYIHTNKICWPFAANTAIGSLKNYEML